MATGRVFSGGTIYLPGAYSKRNYLANLSQNGLAGNILYIIGESALGVPYNAKLSDNLTLLPVEQRVNVIRNFNDAKLSLRSGELYQTVVEALKPALDTTILPPEAIYCIDVATKTRSSTSLLNGVTSVIDLYSKLWGSLANKMAVKVSAATVSGKKVEVIFESEYYVGDNLEQDNFSIQYTGNGTAATITINATGITTALTGQSDGSVNLSIPFATYTSIGQIVDYINTQTGYTATLLGDASFVPDNLDYLTAVNIKTAAVDIQSNLQAIIDWFNIAMVDYIEASHNPSNARLVPDNLAVYKYFTGGTTTAATNTDWAGAFTLLESLNANFIVVCSSDSTVQGYLKSHVESMSGVKDFQERQGGTGASTSASLSDIKTTVKNMNSPLVCYVGTRGIRIKNGVRNSKPGWQTTAKIFSMMAGNGLLFPVTLKELNWDGVVAADSYSNDQKDDMIKNNVTIFYKNERGNLELSRVLNTYQGVDEILQSTAATRLSLFITRDSREKVKEFMRTRRTMLNEQTINGMNALLTANILPDYEKAGYITKDTQNNRPAWGNYLSEVSGDTFRYEFTAIIPLEFNFAFGTYNFTVIGAV